MSSIIIISNIFLTVYKKKGSHFTAENFKNKLEISVIFVKHVKYVKYNIEDVYFII